MAQLVEHALRKQKVMGSSPGGCFVSSGSFRFHSGSVSGLALLTSLANAFARKLDRYARSLTHSMEPCSTK